MSSISDVNSLSSVGSTNGSTSAIASLYKQIQSITQQLKDLASDSTLTEEQKHTQQQMLLAQIQLIQAQITQIEQQHAEEAQQKKDDLSRDIKADGVNRPTLNNQINIYI